MDRGNRTTRPDIPPPQQNYEIALEIAVEELSSRNLAERARAAGATWLSSDDAVEIRMLNRKLRVSATELSVFDPAGGNVELWEKIVALHYLLKATGRRPTGKLISYKEIPDARLYWPNFVARVHKPLLGGFASKPQAMTAIAASLGGRPGEDGDASISIPALPRVDIVYILWKGDEEFAPEAACLFDETITDYLSPEDITMLTSMTVIKMLTAAKGATR